MMKRARAYLGNFGRLSFAIAVLCAVSDPSVAQVQRYRINPGGQYTYFPSPFAGGIPGGQPSDFELDFGVSGFFNVEYDSEMARFLDVDILLTGNEAVQDNPPAGTLVTAERVAMWLEGRLMELLPNLPPWDEYADHSHSDLHLLDFGGSVLLQGGYDARPVDGDGLLFELSATAVPEPAAFVLAVTAAVISMLFLRRGASRCRGCIGLVLCVAAAFTESNCPASTRLVGLGVNYLSLAPLTPAHLMEFDKQTGAASQLGDSIVLESGIGANLASDSNGRLYNLFSHYASDLETEGWLNQISLSTGEVVARTPFEPSNRYVPFVISDIAFDSQGKLYAELISSNPVVDAPPMLAEIDVSTGEVVREFTAGHGYTGLAFDADDNLYAAAVGVGLVRIDVEIGEQTIIGGGLADYGSALPLVEISLAFDRDGTLYAAADRLLVVDSITGATTPVGDTFFRHIRS
jgi:hypothetical protein